VETTPYITSARPLLAVAVSFVGTFLILYFRQNRNLREFWSLAAGALKFLIVASMVPWIWQGKKAIFKISTIIPGIEIKLMADPFGMLFALTSSFLWILTSCYSIGYMRSLDEHSQTRYFSFFAVTLSATIGVAFSANLFTMFLFYEIITLATYPLVAHKETDTAYGGGGKYIIYLLGASKLFLVGGLILTYNLTGTLDFTKGGIFNEVQQEGLIILVFFLFLFGFAKSAVMPLHPWLPAAMVAPTPVSALLHAVAVVKAGVFSILRVIFFIFGVDVMKAIGADIYAIFFASFTILMASVIALSRDNLKARLAYSTVSQLSYIILGAALLAPMAQVGGIIHITNHAFSKITLFFCAGAIYVASHRTEISQLSGIGRRMPWTMTAFTIGAASMIGIPPVSGFISKWYLVIGSLEASKILILVVLLTSTILNAAYFMPVVYKAFFEKFREEDGDHQHEVKEAPKFVLVPLLLTALITILLGLFPEALVDLASKVIG
jgi:multicomponent Na+:H+ antiporter subunit D